MVKIVEKPILDFQGSSYPIKDTNVGCLLDIEVMKSVLTNNQYGALVAHSTVIGNWNLDNVDMFSHLMIMCPELVNKIKASSWREMSIPDIGVLKEEYVKKFVPWFESQLVFLQPVKTVEDKKEQKD